MSDGTNGHDPVKQLIELQQELTALRRKIDRAANAPDRRQEQMPFAGPERRKNARRSTDGALKSDATQ
jgi:hypothetical protein